MHMAHMPVYARPTQRGIGSVRLLQAHNTAAAAARRRSPPPSRPRLCPLPHGIAFTEASRTPLSTVLQWLSKSPWQSEG